MSAAIRTLIVDDEPLAVRGLREMLAGDEDLIVEECSGGRSAIRALEDSRFDLVFLDVQMPRVDGFSVARAIGVNHMPVVVFTTAFSQHAIGAFDVRAIDYLLKPFSQSRLDESVRRAKEEIRRRRLDVTADSGCLPDATAQVPQRSGPEQVSRLLVRSGDVTYPVDLTTVSWIEADGYYARLWTGGRSHLVRQSLTALEAVLDPTTFVRVHRQAIVNLSAVRGIKRLGVGRYRVLLANGATVPLSRDRRGRLQSLLTPTELRAAT